MIRMLKNVRGYQTRGRNDLALGQSKHPEVNCNLEGGEGEE